MKKLIKIMSLSLAVILCIAMMTACTPTKLEDMRKRYEDEGYLVVAISEESAKQYGIEEFDKIEWAMVAMKGSLLKPSENSIVIITRYKDSADAKKDMEEFDKLSDKEKENTFVFRSGSVIVVAPTEEAMKIAK